MHLESTEGSDQTKGLFYKRSMNERRGTETFRGHVPFSSLHVTIQMQRTCRPSFWKTTNVTSGDGLHMETTAGSAQTN